jgi:exoribonuclease-2
MFEKNQAVLYKKNAAVITEIEGDKFVIKYRTAAATDTGKAAKYDSVKVREKDIVPLPAKGAELDALLDFSADGTDEKIAEAYELLQSDETTAGQKISFEELLGLVDGDAAAKAVYFYFDKLRSSFEFSLLEDELKSGALFFVPRSADEIQALKSKADEKAHEAEYRAAFIARLKANALEPGDSKYMGEVEAVALAKIDKSKVMQEIGLAATPENAHKLLLDTGIWQITKNPHPTRWGLSMQSASLSLSSPPEEERYEVPGISYAIDNEWSSDPDDAIAFDGKYLWVHIADPASAILPQSPIDKAAMGRGATLYIPEGAARMLCEDSLEDYALGLKEKSGALSFRLLLNDDGTIEECQVMKTLVRVKRLTYQAADQLKDGELKDLFAIAARNLERRKKAGSVEIDLPEVHIRLDENKKVFVEPEVHPQSSEVVREMMLLAGEGAARFAFANKIPFVYVSQEAPDIPNDLPDGLAGEFKTVKCMRRRSVGVNPSAHAGLGLGMYSQVTSPLRRYGDLLCHEQLRAFLDGRELIDKDAMLERLAAGDEAAYVCKKAERKSDLHWTLVYLLQNPDWTGEAVCVDFKGNEAIFMIPSLAQQTMFAPSKKLNLNDKIALKVKSVDIPNLKVKFVEA